MDASRFGPFGYPVAGEGVERPVIGCWVLVLLAFLAPVLALVPLVPLTGYVVRVVRASADDEPAPLLVVDLRALARRGVGGLVVLTGYLVVPTAAMLVTLRGAETGVRGPGVTLAGGLVLYAGSTVVLAAFLLAAYLVPVGLATYADASSIRAAFDGSSLRPVAGHAAYFSRWVTGALVLGATGWVATVTGGIGRLGPVLAALALAYGTLVTAHVWGRGVRAARAL